MKFPKTLLAALLLLGSLNTGMSQSFTYDVELAENSQVPGANDQPSVLYSTESGTYYRTDFADRAHVFFASATGVEEVLVANESESERLLYEGAISTGLFFTLEIIDPLLPATINALNSRYVFLDFATNQITEVINTPGEIAHPRTYEDRFYVTTDLLEFFVTDGTIEGTVRLLDDLPPDILELSTATHWRLYSTELGVLIRLPNGLGFWNETENRLDTLFDDFLDDSLISQFATFGGKLFFLHDDDICVTDGTRAGSMRLNRPDLPENQRPFPFFGIYTTNNGIVFTAESEQEGRELWVTDGTQAGTQLLRSFASGSEGGIEYYPFDREVETNSLYFFTTTSNEAWVTDGSLAGTVRISTDDGFPDASLEWRYRGGGQTENGEVYTIIGNGENTGIFRFPNGEIIENDQLVGFTGTGVPLEPNSPSDNALVFFGEDFMVFSDPYSFTTLVRDNAENILSIEPGFQPSRVIRNSIYKIDAFRYLVQGFTEDWVRQLRILNLENNTMLPAAHFYQSPEINPNIRGLFGEGTGAVSFIAYEEPLGWGVYTSTGEPENTPRQYGIEFPSLTSNVYKLISNGSQLYYESSNGRYYSYDPETAEKQLIEDNLGIDETFYLRATTGAYDLLEIYNNHSEVILVNRETGAVRYFSRPAGYTFETTTTEAVGGKFYFKAITNGSGLPDDLLLVLDPVAETLETYYSALNTSTFFGNTDQLIKWRDQLYFVMNSGGESVVYRTDGTTDGIVAIQTLATTPSLAFESRVLKFGDLAYSLINRTIYQLNEDDTVEEIGEINESEPNFLGLLNGGVIYNSSNRLHRFDLVSGETTNLSGIIPSTLNFRVGTVSNGKLFFSAQIIEFGNPLDTEYVSWISDGTLEGTFQLSDQRLSFTIDDAAQPATPFSELPGATAMILWNEDFTERNLYVYDHFLDQLFLLDIDDLGDENESEAKLIDGKLYFSHFNGEQGPGIYVLNFGESISPTSGVVFHDQNENGLRETSEPGINNLRVIATGERSATAFSNEQGAFDLYLQPSGSNYTILAPTERCWELTSDTTFFTVHPDSTNNPELLFGYRLTSEITSLRAHLTSSQIRCGFTVQFWLTVTNDGCQPLPAEVSLDLGENVTFVSADLPATEDGTLLLWSLDTLQVGEVKNIRLELIMPGEDFNDQPIPLTVITQNAAITDTFFYADILSCAIDPNDKQVLPRRPEASNSNYTRFDETLLYTVRFQNTGTDTAFTVRIEDQLSSDLDPATFRPLSASHPYRASMDENGLVQFLFEDIMLPDSNVNEPLSHGYVTFEVDFKVAISEGAAVENTAAIYFDFNRPVITNTVTSTAVEFLDQDQDGFFFWDECNDENELVNPAAEDLTVNGIDENCDGEDGIVNVRNLLGGVTNVFPNPTNDHVIITFSDARNLHYNLYDLRGKLLLNGSFSEQASINLGAYPAGIYLVKITDSISRLFTVRKVERL